MIVKDPDVTWSADRFGGWRRNGRFIFAVVLCAYDKINFADVEAGCLQVDIAADLDQHRKFLLKRSPIPRSFFSDPVGRQDECGLLIR